MNYLKAKRLLKGRRHQLISKQGEIDPMVRRALARWLKSNPDYFKAIPDQHTLIYIKHAMQHMCESMLRDMEENTHNVNRKDYE